MNDGAGVDGTAEMAGRESEIERNPDSATAANRRTCGKKTGSKPVLNLFYGRR
jgi:hypothetical protein